MHWEFHSTKKLTHLVCSRQSCIDFRELVMTPSEIQGRVMRTEFVSVLRLRISSSCIPLIFVSMLPFFSNPAMSQESSEVGNNCIAKNQLSTTAHTLATQHGMREELASTGYIARTTVIESRLELLNMEKELTVQGNRLSESAASLNAAMEQRKQAQAEFHARASAERVEAIRKQDGARQELAKATQRRELQTLRSPIDGVVQQLAVTTVGGVVTPAQPLMSIVPHNAVLEVDAQVLNRDVGHVKVGQRVINKVETFDFTRFGYIEGTVQWVGTDAVNDQKLGPVYPVRIKLIAAETPNTVNGLHGAVIAGLSVTADIRTGERRLIEYFIAPLLRYQQEALRER
jgi:hemolysin D